MAWLPCLYLEIITALTSLTEFLRGQKTWKPPLKFAPEKADTLLGAPAESTDLGNFPVWLPQEAAGNQARELLSLRATPEERPSSRPRTQPVPAGTSGLHDLGENQVPYWSTFGEGLIASKSTNTTPGGRNVSCCLGSCQHFCPSRPATASCPLPTATAKEPKAPPLRVRSARSGKPHRVSSISVSQSGHKDEGVSQLQNSVLQFILLLLSWECVFYTSAFLKCPFKKVHKMMVIDDGSFCCVLNVLTWKNLKITQLCPFTQCLFWILPLRRGGGDTKPGEGAWCSQRAALPLQQQCPQVYQNL